MWEQLGSGSSEMLETEREQARDWEVAKRISREARSHPDSPYAGKYVGILDGEIVTVNATLEEAIEAMAAIDPDPDRGTIVEASADYDVTHYVWGAT